MQATPTGAILLGDFVRYIVPTDRRKDSFARGRVVAVETYTDFHGSRVWFYVNWFDHDGRPEKETLKHAADELETAGGST